MDSTGAQNLHRSNAVHGRQRRQESSATPAVALISDEDANLVAANQRDAEAAVEETGLRNLQEERRTGQNTVQLLFRVSEEATIRNSYIHRGCVCNACGTVPIRGIRYKCANCADFDLCEGCEAQGLHTQTHVFLKIKVPIAPPAGSGQMLPVWYSGDPDTKMRALPRQVCTRISRETGLDRPELDAYWEQFCFMANTEWREDPDEMGLVMDRLTFEKYLIPVSKQKHAPPSLICERMFAFYDTNGDDLISFPEFVQGISYRKQKNKWKKIFDGYDIDGDGYVDRKDFLRIFRSYYVLHKLMQADVLRGLEEQQLSTTETYALINGRQPLSSAFGQDGSYPPGADFRTGEGKRRNIHGEYETEASVDALAGDTHDHGNRNDVFRRRLPRQQDWVYGRRGIPNRRRGGLGGMERNRVFAAVQEAFAEVIMNPPTTIEQVPNLLDALAIARQDAHDLNVRLGETAIEDEPARANDEPINHETTNGNSAHETKSKAASENSWPPSFVEQEDVDALNLDTHYDIHSVPASKREEVKENARDRISAKQDVHERWQRRQFYTDEEEGIQAPDDWNDEMDLLARNDEAGPVKSGTSHRPSMHSRSSSKVRFAEDMDDYDIRSNPSTSSRSVPERWGGIEISDAEKDAGKEILYQITQQAYNELLDGLFKEKEDLAVEAAGNRKERDQYREHFDNPGMKKKFAAMEIADRTNTKRPSSSDNVPLPPRVSSRRRSSSPIVWPAAAGTSVELADVRRVPIQVLLRETGYTVEESDSGSDAAGTDKDIPESAPSPPPAIGLEDPSDDESDDTQSQGSREDCERHRDDTGARTSGCYTDDSEALARRDPTMPQFRPNSSVLDAHGSQEASLADFENLSWNPPRDLDPLYLGRAHGHSRQSNQRHRLGDDGQRRRHLTPEGHSRLRIIPTEVMDFLGLDDDDSPTSSSRGSQLGGYSRRPPTYVRDLSPSSASSSPQALPTDLLDISEEALYRLYRCDKAAREAKERGGWGRLNFDEFDAIVKKHALSSKMGSNSLDYLGSWIEFCIPLS